MHESRFPVLTRASLLCAFILLSSFCVGQEYNLRSYSVEDGLSQSQAMCIFEDSRGFLWIGTSGGGVNRFDGNSFLSYEEKDGLCGQIITSITEDAKGNMWFGTPFNGVCEYDGSKFRKISVNDGLPSNKILSLVAGKDGRVFIGTDNGLCIFDKGRFITINKDPVTHEVIVVKMMYMDKNDNLYLGTNIGVYRLNGKEITKIRNKSGQPNGEIAGIGDDAKGDLLIFEAPSQSYVLDAGGEIGFMKVLEGLPGAVTSVLTDSRKRTWITTMGHGVFKIQDGNEIHITEKNGLSSNLLNCVLEDREGNVWFGTNGAGILKYRDDRFLYYQTVPGFGSPAIFSIYAASDNTIWSGSYGDGITKLDPQGNTRTWKEGLPNRTNAITGFDNTIWAGTTEGIYVLQGDRFVFKKIIDSAEYNVRMFFHDSNGDLWIGTSGLGLIRYTKGGKSTVFGNSSGLLNLNVYSMVEKNGKLWFGTGDGLYYIDPASDKIARISGDGLCNSYIGSLVTDKKGGLWVGTDRCIASFDGKTFHSYDENSGLSSGTVYLMNVDKQGNIWVGTNKGIDKIELDDDGSIGSIKNYGKKDGFKGIECNSRATCLDGKGNLWFGTIKGAIRYNPAEDFPDTTAPKVFINDIRLYFEKVKWEKFQDSLTPWFHLPHEHVFSFGQNHLTFEFSSTSKSFPEKVVYSFFLEGFDKEWSPPSTQTGVTYSNLPAGRYVFKVKAQNADGAWTEVPASFNFRILYPFWASWWFITACVLFLLFAVNRYNKIRKRQLERANKELESIVAERTAELTKQKEEKEILLKEIHHRVKNNLQVINSLINLQSGNVKDPEALSIFEECKNRIKSISLIHESLYKSNQVSQINLRDYLSMMVKSLIDTYRIDKNIELKTDLNIHYLNLNTILPLGLMLNEIISNSLKYAFPDRKDGEIYIQLKADGEFYELTIGDNGIGYKGDPFEGDHPTLGLELVKILADQLDGTIQKMSVEGTYYYLKFKPSKK